MADAKMQEAFVKSKGSKRVSAISQPQKVRTAFIHGVLAERLRSQYRDCGFYYCEECSHPSRVNQFSSGEGLAVAVSFHQAWAMFDPGHLLERTKGGRYSYAKEPDFGIDDPSNIIVECRGCNSRRKEGTL